MRACAQADDRLAREIRVNKMLHHSVRVMPETQHHENRIGIIERFRAGQIVPGIWIDRAVFFIQGEKHRALEAVPNRENLCDLRQTFLGTILFIACQKTMCFPAPGPEPPS